jgi:hypothetical protein
MQGGDLKRVSGLWLKDGKKGKFMSGQIDAEMPAGTKLLVFKNDKKNAGDKLPDYHLYAVGADGDSQHDNGRRHQAPAADRGRVSATPAPTSYADQSDSDSTPF